jgi:deazaflavin-dependent oxidoreductase (nitroreductase family)
MVTPLLAKIFWFFNKFFMVPLFRLGLGPLFGNPFWGYMMVLKVTGRKSGKTRFAPVNYAILNGNVYCLAGRGQLADWYRNMIANPNIEVILPSGTIAGVVDEVPDSPERTITLRKVLKAGGFAGFMLGLNPFTASDDELTTAANGLPVMRIKPTGIGSGASDYGGWVWIAILALLIWLSIK